MSAAKESAARRHTRKLFAWLNQIKTDPELLPSAFLVAFEIGQHFNRKHGGAAWPSIQTLAKATGLSEPSVVRLTRLLAHHGYLRVDPGKAGRGYSNCYFMALQKGASAHHKRHGKTSADGGFTAAQKTSAGETKTSAHGVELSKTIYGDANASPIDERDGSLTLTDSTTGARRLNGGAPEAGKVVEEQKAKDRFAELLAIWKRPWADDDEADARRALDQADTDLDIIIAGAWAWVAAADDPRFLPKLSKWLRKRCWEREPPKRRRARGKASPANAMLKAGGLQ